MALPSARRDSVLRPALLLAAALLAMVASCARAECVLNSDCPARSFCSNNVCARECAEDRDCTRAGTICNPNGRCVAGTPEVDAGPDSRIDGGRPDVPQQPDVPGPDNVTPPDVPVTVRDVPEPVDTPMPMDVPVVGRGAYLDACTGDGDCASGMCATGSPRFCTRACAVHSECAHGQMCAGGRCALDDIGRAGCDPTTATPCQQYCIGTTRASHCTRDCVDASDCPAGFGCMPVSGRRVCVDIERPCTTAEDCPSSMGFCGAGMVGCTAQCNTAADCPHRLVGLPPYTCEDRSGTRVCVPPADVVGSDALGTACTTTGTGLNYCRSGACDDGTTPPSCNQRCTAQGGCGSGFGCFPLVDTGNILLVCTATGRNWLGQTCSRARDCVTGLCSTDNYCTRMCVDGICPTGMFCRNTGLAATDGTPIRLCSR